MHKQQANVTVVTCSSEIHVVRESEESQLLGKKVKSHDEAIELYSEYAYSIHFNVRHGNVKYKGRTSVIREREMRGTCTARNEDLRETCRTIMRHSQNKTLEVIAMQRL